MGEANSRCDCGNNESKINFDSYIEYPNIGKEDVHQIWKCFEYLNPKNGIVDYKSLLKSKNNTPVYMNEIVEIMLQSHSDISFDQFFKIMKPKVLSVKTYNSDSVLMESNSTNVSCLICPYKSSNGIVNSLI